MAMERAEGAENIRRQVRENVHKARQTRRTAIFSLPEIHYSSFTTYSSLPIGIASGLQTGRFGVRIPVVSRGFLFSPKI
jgi:hypothetical protein